MPCDVFTVGLKKISEFRNMTEIDGWAEATACWKDSRIHFRVKQTDDSDDFKIKIWSLKLNELRITPGGHRQEIV